MKFATMLAGKRTANCGAPTPVAPAGSPLRRRRSSALQLAESASGTTPRRASCFLRQTAFPNSPLRMKKNSGFSLLEIMIVVAIIADIVVIAVPSYMRSRQFTQDTRFMTDLRTAVDGFEMYAAERSSYPPNAAPGVVPAGMQQYLSGVDWSNPNTLGGSWNWDNNRNGSVAAVGVLLPGG